SDLYKFDIAGGEKVLFDVTARSNGNNARWRLLDPYLNVIFETDFSNTGNDVGPLTLTRAGTYTLILEGRFFDTTPGSYTVVATKTGTDVVPPFPTGTPLTLGNTINDSVSVAGEQDIYTFNLVSSARLYFDVLSPNDSNFVWSLLGPSGTIISSRSFHSSDSHDIGNPV